MIKQTLAILVAGATLALSPLAHADDRGRGRGHDKHDHRGHVDRHDRRDHGRDFRHDGRRDYRHYDYGPGRPVVIHRAPPRHVWVRGGRLPPVYRERYYVVQDWHAHRLYRPNPGYQWVQVGPEYLLVAIASGVIANIILSQ